MGKLATILILPAAFALVAWAAGCSWAIMRLGKMFSRKDHNAPFHCND